MERRRIARVATKLDLHSPNSDLAYWLSRPVEERIGAVTELRHALFGVAEESQSRIQKAVRVVKRS